MLQAGCATRNGCAPLGWRCATQNLALGSAAFSHARLATGRAAPVARAGLARQSDGFGQAAAVNVIMRPPFSAPPSC